MMRTNKSQFFVLPLVMYTCIVVMIVILAVVIALFEPSNFKEIDNDQKSLSYLRELRSAYDLQVNGHDFVYWGSIGMSPGSAEFAYYDSVFESQKLCGGVFAQDLTSESFSVLFTTETAIGSNECHIYLNYLFSNFQSDAMATLVRPVSEKQLVIIPEDESKIFNLFLYRHLEFNGGLGAQLERARR